MKASVYNQKGDKVKDKTLSEAVFSVPVKEELVHQAAVCQAANERQILANTKTRSEVRGGGAKPWRQKGTGRARAGSSRSPIWIGGGITFGPLAKRNFKKRINKKMKQKALLMSLSDRMSTDNMAVLDKIDIKTPKTKEFEGIISDIENKVFKKDNKNKRSILMIVAGSDDNAKLSGRNLQGVSIINIDNLNILDLLKSRHIIATEEAVNRLEKAYSNK